MTEPEQHADLKIYINCLQSAKIRLRILDRIVAGDLKIEDEVITAEFACLQFRRCLELIAYASVAAHKEIYARAHEKFEHHWRGKGILENLRRVHPDFYPVPVVVEREPGKVVKLSRIMNEYLTEDDFVVLFDICNNATHEWNPYSPRERVLVMKRPMAEWVARIWRLLWMHTVRLVDKKDIWIVNFDGEDGLVHAYPATSLPPKEPAPSSITQN
jgi:hypothetical protein